MKCSGTYYLTWILFNPRIIRPRYYLTSVLPNIRPGHTIIIMAVAKISSRERLPNLSLPVVKVLHQKSVLDAQVRVDFGCFDPLDQHIIANGKNCLA